MKNLKITGLILILFLLNSCFGKNAKNEEMEKKEIVKVLSNSNNWFQETKEKWFDNFQNEDWNDLILVNWIKESNYFSKNFFEGLEPNLDNSKHFGLYFYDYQDIGGMLKALCDEDEEAILQRVKKISDDKYRYITHFSTVLNSIPDPNYDEKYMWMWETGEKGEIWYFSIIIIKENNQWLIDKFERYYSK
ncbi:MAG: hypothetical protein JEY96_19480 [Bacteroidales bacterium]|nr:hypothetical protein [Bacteroidales bacterium]